MTPIKSYDKNKKIFKPMRFHYFYIYFSLPFSILSSFALLKEGSSIKEMYYYNQEITDIISLRSFLLVVAVITTVIAIVGLHKLKPYGLASWFFSELSVISTNCTLLVFDTSESTLGTIFGGIISSILIGVYYYKRRRLFYDQEYRESYYEHIGAKQRKDDDSSEQNDTPQ